MSSLEDLLNADVSSRGRHVCGGGVRGPPQARLGRVRGLSCLVGDRSLYRQLQMQLIICYTMNSTSSRPNPDEYPELPNRQPH